MKFQMCELPLNEHGVGLVEGLLEARRWHDDHNIKIVANDCMMVWARQHFALIGLIQEGAIVSEREYPEITGMLPTSRHFYLTFQ
jgi:hypothetical protein